MPPGAGLELGAVQGRGDTGGPGRGGGSWGGRGFLKIALEDFIREFLWVEGTVNFLSHLGPSGVFRQVFFSF